MKILHTVEFYTPSIGGMQEVVKQLSERLVQRGHEVTVATSALNCERAMNVNGVNIREFRIAGNFVRGLHGEVEEYRKFLLNSEFDVITNFAAQQWATDIALPELDHISVRKIFVPTGFSGLYDPAYKSYFANMPLWMKKYDNNVFLSADYRDINFARAQGLKNITLIPNAAGADEFGAKCDVRTFRQNIGISQDAFLILLVGSHVGTKGHMEAMRIFQQAKMKNAVLLIVGNQVNGGCTVDCKAKAYWSRFSIMNKFSDKKILVMELNRKDTVAAYHAADLFLFPSRIECSPLVLFEAMASRTPFLVTDVGNSKEIQQWSNGGGILPTQIKENGFSSVDVEGSAKVLEAVYQDPESRRKMADAGYSAWNKHFTWENVAAQYERIYSAEKLQLRNSLESGTTSVQILNEKKSELCYLGQGYGKRIEQIAVLFKQGYLVDLYGYGWPSESSHDSLKLYSIGSLPCKSLRDRIVLNLNRLKSGAGRKRIKEILCERGRGKWNLIYGKIYWQAYRTACAIKNLFQKWKCNTFSEPVFQYAAAITECPIEPRLLLPRQYIHEESGFSDRASIVQAHKVNLIFSFLSDATPCLPSKLSEADWIPLILGGFCLVEYMPGIEKHFVVGEEIVCWRDNEELTSLIDYYLTQDSEREKLRIAGQKKIQKIFLMVGVERGEAIL